MKRSISRVIRWGAQIFDKDQFIYAALGDSTAEGIGASSPDAAYPSLLAKYLTTQYKNVVYVNFGKRGAKSRHVLATQVDKAIAKQPHLITLSVGANDIRFGVTIRTFSNQLKQILIRLQSETRARIVVTSIPDFSDTPRVPKFLKRPTAISIKRYNIALSLIARELKIPLVNVFPAASHYFKRHPEVIASDGFHPSDFGYYIWANSILMALRQIKIVV